MVARYQRNILTIGNNMAVKDIIFMTLVICFVVGFLFFLLGFISLMIIPLFAKKGNVRNKAINYAKVIGRIGCIIGAISLLLLLFFIKR